MKKQNYNHRKCIIKNKKLPKSELIRICIVENKIVIDQNKTLKGRGYYLSSNLENIDNIKIKNLLEKKLHVCVDNDTIMLIKSINVKFESE